MKIRQACKQFESYLADTGGRLTSQKKMIASLIFETKGHFEIEELIDRLHQKNPMLSRATVYRTLRQLIEADLIQKISAMDGKVLYERKISENQHDHIVCNVCGKIYEIQDTAVQDILAAYCEKIGFQSAYRSLHIYGKCKQCVKRALGTKG